MRQPLVTSLSTNSRSTATLPRRPASPNRVPFIRTVRAFAHGLTQAQRAREPLLFLSFSCYGALNLTRPYKTISTIRVEENVAGSLLIPFPRPSQARSAEGIEEENPFFEPRV